MRRERQISTQRKDLGALHDSRQANKISLQGMITQRFGEKGLRGGKGGRYDERLISKDR